MSQIVLITGCSSGFGELIAWLIGWDLVLEYTVAVAAVAVGWSGYANDAVPNLWDRSRNA